MSRMKHIPCFRRTSFSFPITVTKHLSQQLQGRALYLNQSKALVHNHFLFASESICSETMARQRACGGVKWLTPTGLLPHAGPKAIMPSNYEPGSRLIHHMVRALIIQSLLKSPSDGSQAFITGTFGNSSCSNFSRTLNDSSIL